MDIGAVESHVRASLGQDSGRASVTFLGTEQIDVLRFGPDNADVVRYVTVGMSRTPMSDPLARVVDVAAAPRAEIFLSLRAGRDVARSLAVLAAVPAVEGVVVAAGASLDLGTALWPGAPFTSVLVGAPAGLIADLPTPGAAAVEFFPVLPMTPTEAAWKRVHGGAALEQRWLEHGVDIRDPDRGAVDLR
ncbi:MAG: suppressor of fused domain protein [Mycobacteriales bacterium]